MNLLSILILTNLSVAAVASPPVNPISDRRLDVTYSTPAQVESLLSNKGILFNAGKVFTRPLSKGKIEVKFGHVFSNKCVAGSYIVQPEAAISNDRVTVAIGYTMRKIMCPAVAAPVLVNFSFKLEGLKAGSSYRLLIGTRKETIKRKITLP